MSKKNIRQVIIIAVITVIVTVSIMDSLHIVKIQGSSMSPTYENGELVRYKKLENISSLSHGDIIIYKTGFMQMVIKRVIGLPGDTLYIEDGKLYVNGVLDERYENIEYAGVLENKIILGENEFFCMGDNVNNSADCRKYGAKKWNAFVGMVSNAN